MHKSLRTNIRIFDRPNSHPKLITQTRHPRSQVIHTNTTRGNNFTNYIHEWDEQCVQSQIFRELTLFERNNRARYYLEETYIYLSTKRLTTMCRVLYLAHKETPLCIVMMIIVPNWTIKFIICFSVVIVRLFTVDHFPSGTRQTELHCFVSISNNEHSPVLISKIVAKLLSK